jgi:type IV pilus assembly protein PilY1
MKKHPKKHLVLFIIGAFLLIFASPSWTAEPSMADYTSYPAFMSGQVPPNIMVMLDNSGSMNFNAYGTWPGTDGYVTDDPFQCGLLEVQIYDSEDDVEETAASGGYNNNGDLDIGYYDYDTGTKVGSNKTYVGLRFQNLAIPKDATITNAYFELSPTGSDSQSDPADTTILIKGQDTDHAENFVNEAYGLSGRTTTTASVTWSNVPLWTSGNTYQTPDLSAIVQEIVDRDGWNSGQAMAFIITAEGKRDASPRNNGITDAPKLHVEYTGGCKEYYGYFDPDARYSYSSSIFSRNPSGDWSGNFLNWLTMRRIDVARKVLMGGLANPRTYAGTQKLNGENSPSSRNYRRWYDGTNTFDGSGGAGVTPYDDGVYSYRMEGDDLKVYTQGGTYKATYQIVVEKVAAEEPEDFADLDGSGPTTVGVFQRYGNNGRWGNLWFNNNGTGNNGNGGVVSNGIDDKVTSSFVNDLQNKSPDTWTPLAEAFYTAAQYYAQKGIDSNLDYANNPGTTKDDPFDGAEPCAKNFVLLITDGASTMDAMIPSSLKHYADAYDTFVTTDSNDCTSTNESNYDSCKYGSAGTDFLKDVALWARTTDLRSSSYGKDEIDGTQNIILYTVYAFGNESNARELLKEAAKNGGFEDLDGDNAPNQQAEWDNDSDGVPDAYFEAEDGASLQKSLGAAIAAIMERASSGTASSVLATNSEGEATLLQAYFMPKVYQSGREVAWTGYLQSLWVDYCGNLREDSNDNQTLDLDTDKIVEYFYDTADSETKVRRYTSHPLYSDPKDCGGDFSGAVSTTVTMNDVSPLFEAGERLAETDAGDRRIFTYIDKDEDNAVDEATYSNFDGSGELIAFTTANAALLDPYLGVEDAVSYSHLGSSHSDRIDNLIDYIRGVDLFDSSGNATLRPRTLEVNGSDQVWKLGDIVHSTPVTVAKPMDNYNIIYSDESYQDYYDSVKDRESVVYVGGNDGMLHAFTSWKYNEPNKQFEDPYPSDSSGDATFIDGEKIGSEIWSYIPQSLLPHLKWLSDPDYTHVYYADLQPKVVDAQILPDTNGDGKLDWGTFLLLGLNMGGKQIWTNEFGASGTDTRYFNPSYTCINITDPRNPIVMWERSYDGLGLSTSIPGIIKVDDEWMLVIGSGPTDYEGISTQNAHIYVVDLKDGTPFTGGSDDWLFELAESNAFLNSPVSVDYRLNYNVDGIYLGETYCDSGDCGDPTNYTNGMVYKIPVPCDPCEWDSDGTTKKDPDYKEDPTTWGSPSVLLKSDGTYTVPSITGTMSISKDDQNSVWVYLGTGRFIDDTDKASIQQNYLMGIKDPFFNIKHYDDAIPSNNYYLDFTKSLTLTPSDLFNSDEIVVTKGGTVFDNGGSTIFGTAGKWGELIDAVRNKDGWMRSLEISATAPSERCISKPGILGGVVLFPTFTPDPDICSGGGTTGFYGLYYETGTAYYKHIFETPSPDQITYDSKTLDIVEPKIQGDPVGTPPPTSGIHVGRQNPAKAFIQLSTGEILEIDFEPAKPIRSNMVNWRLGR